MRASSGAPGLTPSAWMPTYSAASRLANGCETVASPQSKTRLSASKTLLPDRSSCWIDSPMPSAASSAHQPASAGSMTPRIRAASGTTSGRQSGTPSASRSGVRPATARCSSAYPVIIRSQRAMPPAVSLMDGPPSWASSQPRAGSTAIGART
jgi:hypothetical protein